MHFGTCILGYATCIFGIQGRGWTGGHKDKLDVSIGNNLDLTQEKMDCSLTIESLGFYQQLNGGFCCQPWI